MSNDELERLLASAPTRELSPAAEERIVSAVRTAQPRPAARWWARPVPLWQAIAACAAVCVTTLSIASMGPAAEPSNSGPVRSAVSGQALPQPAPATTAPITNDGRPRRMYQTDTSQWVLRVTYEGAQE